MNHKIIPYTNQYYQSLMAFFAKNCPEITPKIWDEKYQNHPKSNYGKIFENILLNENDEVVGHSAWHQIKVIIGGENYLGAWFIDWFVATEYKGKGAGKALALDTIPEDTDILLVARGTEDTLVRLKKWEFSNPTTSYVYLLPLSAQTIINRKDYTGIKSKFVKFCWALIKRYFRKTEKKLMANFFITAEKTIPEIQRQGINHSERSNTAIDYFNSFTNTDIIIYTINECDTYRGHMIVNCYRDSFGLNIAKILDVNINIDADNISTTFINNIIFKLQTKDIDAIEWMTNDKTISMILEKIHFIKRDQAPLHIKSLTKKCEISTNNHNEWDLSFFDSDLFYRN